MLKTVLYDEHMKLHAKIVEFAGWQMPIQYTSVKDEVLSVRNNVGMFDASHMGEFLVEGKDAYKFVDYMMCNDFLLSAANKAVYSPLCREDGTIVDDHIAYKLESQKVLLCVNASNLDKDWKWFNKHIKNFSCTITDLSSHFALIAIQGPKSDELLTKLELFPKDGLPYYSVKSLDYILNDKKYSFIIARTGYTGEKGIEVFCPTEAASSLWQLLLDNGVAPCGLASRDILRLEACFPLYGHELNDTLTPFDSNLKWTVKLNKSDFIGKKTLEAYSPKYTLVKLSLETGIPRQDYKVFNNKKEIIGQVSSGTLSPVLNKGICLAHIEKEKMPSDKSFFIEIRNKIYPAIYHDKAFVTGGVK